MNFRDATPLGNQSPLKHAVWCKNDGDTPKNVFSGAWHDQKPKKCKETFERDTSPLCQGDPTGPIFTIFGVLGHTGEVIKHTNFQVDCARG